MKDKDVEIEEVNIGVNFTIKMNFSNKKLDLSLSKKQAEILCESLIEALGILMEKEYVYIPYIPSGNVYPTNTAEPPFEPYTTCTDASPLTVTIDDSGKLIFPGLERKI